MHMGAAVEQTSSVITCIEVTLDQYEEITCDSS